jgi:hypothetical protein
MSENNTQNPDSFEKCVAEQFNHLINLEKLPPTQQAKAADFKGCMFPFYLLFKVFAPLEKWGLKKEAEQNNYKEFDTKADELLNNQEIRQHICETIGFEGSREIITSEKFGEIIINSLNNMDLKAKYDYPINYVLFTFVAYKVHKVGLKKFCDNVEKETQ